MSGLLACTASSAEAENESEGSPSMGHETHDHQTTDDQGQESSGTGQSTDSSTDPSEHSDSRQCDPGKQDCTDPLQKCSPYLHEKGSPSVDATHCVPAGTRQLGQTCFRDATAGNDDCETGLFCFAGRSIAHGANPAVVDVPTAW